MLSNQIDPTARISPDARLGVANVIGAFTIIGPGVQIGDGNWIGPHVTLGALPDHRAAAHSSDWTLGAEEDGTCLIGGSNVIREGTVVQRGLRSPTSIGDRCYLMANVYVAHDCQISSDVTLAAAAVLAGHVAIDRGANIGAGARVRQFTRIGSGSMVGMGATVVTDLPPLSLSMGMPCRVVGTNRRGLERLGMGPDAIDSIDRILRTHSAPERRARELALWEAKYLTILEESADLHG